MKIEFLPEADNEFREAARYYEGKGVLTIANRNCVRTLKAAFRIRRIFSHPADKTS